MVNDALATGQRSTMLYLASQLDYYNNLSCPLPGRPAMQNEQDVLREELRRLEE